MIFVMTASDMDKHERMNDNYGINERTGQLNGGREEALYFGLFRYYNKPS